MDEGKAKKAFDKAINISKKETAMSLSDALCVENVNTFLDLVKNNLINFCE